MEHKFTLSFPHKDKQYNLDSMFMRQGYIHQFHVAVDGNTLIIEFDEEREYRILESFGHKDSAEYDIEFLQALVQAISKLH